MTETDERARGVSPALRDSILAWYDREGRDLPFRATRDPYAILVSEVMAQQTQAARAGEAWNRFAGLFPTVSVLADATPADVLRAWQGLGYNRRALDLWRAARRIVDAHGGEVPADVAALEALPGVGPYTARAVCALAFGLPVGAVDTNVRRVLVRILVGGNAIGTATLQRLADASVPIDRPGAWTHALMDLGATLCRPRSPDCARCPAQASCRYAEGRFQGTADGGASDTRNTGPTRASRRTARASRSAPSAAPSAAPFATTSRWLRGRIVDRLRAANGDGWTVVDGPIGSHDGAAVAAALEGLARDGLVELDNTGLDLAPQSKARRVRVRLPVT
ncbi:MAG: A/G-specific adenine glycosylase [Chloroflexota bacterium]